MLKVVIMNQGLAGAIPFYRLYQPLKYCERKGLLKAVFHDPNTSDKAVLDELDDADIIVWQCPTSLNVWNWLCAVKNENTHENRNRKVVIEFDDSLKDISPWNEKYRVFGTQESYITISNEEKPKYDRLNKMVSEGKKEVWQLPDGRWEYKLWQDGEDGFDLKDNNERMQAAMNIVKECDLFQCTTKELAKTWHQHSDRRGKTAILPNLIDFNRWLPQKKNDTDKIRIAWQGGSSHYKDWKEVLPALQRLQLEYGDRLEFVVAGQTWKGIHGKLKNVEEHGWHSDIRTYPLMTRNLKADIGIIPLEDNKFNRGKSALKWLEYSALGIPTIASDVTPYKEVIEYGKTGYLVKNTTDDWYEHIKFLIEDKELATKMAKKARARVKKKWSIDRSIEWLEAYETLNAYSTVKEMVK